MKRTSIDAFKAEIGAALKEAGMSSQARDENEATKVRTLLECTKAGIAILAGAAMLSASIDGFPLKIDLSSPNGHNAGLSASREGHVWRIQGSLEVLRTAATYSFGMGYTTSIADKALAAMRIPHSAEAIGRLSAMLVWKPGDDAMDEIAKAVPPHTMAAMAGLGWNACNVFSVPDRDQESFVKAMFRTIEAEGTNLDVAPSDRTLPPVIALAALGHDDFLQFALAQGFLRTNVRSGRYTAATAAVETGRLATLRLLSRRGERLDFVDESGNTLLHIAAGLVSSKSPEVAAAIARFLVGQGLDPALSNARGQTPSDIATELAADEDAEDDGDWARDQFDAALTGAARPVPSR